MDLCEFVLCSLSESGVQLGVKLVEKVLICSSDEQGQASLPGRCPFQLPANTGLFLSGVSPLGLLTATVASETRNRRRIRRWPYPQPCAIMLHVASCEWAFSASPSPPSAGRVVSQRWRSAVGDVGLVPKHDPSLSGSPVPLKAGLSAPLLMVADGKLLQMIRCLVV